MGISEFDLHPATVNDDEFSFHLYCSSRQAEIAAFGWNPKQSSDFLRMQYNAREQVYRIQHPGLENSLIFVGDQPIGRLLVSRDDDAISLVDISIMPDLQGKGIGSSVIMALQAEAAETNRKVRLSVDPLNAGAQRVYLRLGFVVSCERETTILMEWKPEKYDHVG